MRSFLAIWVNVIWCGHVAPVGTFGSDPSRVCVWVIVGKKGGKKRRSAKKKAAPARRRSRRRRSKKAKA
jgi:hypothetical protein